MESLDSIVLITISISGFHGLAVWSHSLTESRMCMCGSRYGFLRWRNPSVWHQSGFLHWRNPNWCQKYAFLHRGNPYMHAFMHIFGFALFGIQICAYMHSYMDFPSGEILIFGACLDFSNGEMQAGAKNTDFSIGEIHICMHICTYLGYPNMCMCASRYGFLWWRSPSFWHQSGFLHWRSPNWC